MDDTTSISELDITPFRQPAETASAGLRLCRLLRLCRRNVEEHNRDKLRKELAKEVFQTRSERKSFWSGLLDRLR